MFITKAGLRRELAVAWDGGHVAGVEHGRQLQGWEQDREMGFGNLPEPTPVLDNPYREES